MKKLLNFHTTAGSFVKSNYSHFVFTPVWAPIGASAISYLFLIR